jgi:hypothetical protein
MSMHSEHNLIPIKFISTQISQYQHQHQRQRQRQRQPLYQCHRSFTSNKNVGDSSEEELQNTPLSSLSADDLNLAMQAANEDRDVDVHKKNSELIANDDATTVTTNSSLNIDDLPGATAGKSKKLAIIFTCNVCNTRSAKRFSEQAYNHGVVLVRCPKCESLHLIADRLGYFGDEGEDGKGWDIETFMKSIGQEDNVKVATEGQELLEVTLKDVLGDKIHATSQEDDEKEKNH